MNIWVRRSLEAAVLAAGFAIVGAGAANAAEPATDAVTSALPNLTNLSSVPDPTGLLGGVLGNQRHAAPAGAGAVSHKATGRHAAKHQRRSARDSKRAYRPGRHAAPAPVHGAIDVPMDVGDNAIGTPLGQLDLPSYTDELSTRTVTEPVEEAVGPVVTSAGPAGDVSGPAAAAVGEVTSAVATVGRRGGGNEDTPFPRPNVARQGVPQGDALLGNRADAGLVVPLQISGNAIAAGGPAYVEGIDHSQSYDNTEDVTTGGAGSPLAGNVVDADWAVPVQLANNAVAAVGTAETVDGRAEQNVSTGGDDVTDGRDGFLAGNVLAGQWATPVQATGNAATLLGRSDVADSRATDTTTSGGAVDTWGTGGVGSGNVGIAPLGLPLELNGNAPAGGGIATATAHAADYVTTGGTMSGNKGRPTWVQTDGDSAFGSGNVVQPQGALVGSVASNAAAGAGQAFTGGAHSPFRTEPVDLLGRQIYGSSATYTVWPPEAMRSASSTSSTTNKVTSGGYTTTSSRDGGLSGNVADAPVAAPAELVCVAGSAVGDADCADGNKTTNSAGGKTFTNGNGSTLSGNTASSPLATTAEGFGAGGSAVGSASSTTQETKNVKAGGYNGSLGDDSLGSGNLAETPISAPGETFGLGGAAAGQSAGTATETKNVTAGSDGNTNDDNGTLASNVLAAPVALPAQAFGIGAGGVGRGTGKAKSHTTAKAGHKYTGTGALGTIAGNIVQAPLAWPAQVHGIGGGVGGVGRGLSSNTTAASAGGPNLADGTDGAAAGNVVQAPTAGAGSVFGHAADGLGLADGHAGNDVTSTAGGSTDTAGDGGALSGDVVSGQFVPLAQAFGAAADAIGGADSTAMNATTATSGGDIATTGADGALAGQALDVPAAAVPQAFGDTASLLGSAGNVHENDVVGTAGGSVTDAGGIGQLPVRLLAQVNKLNLPLAGTAFSAGENNTDVLVGQSSPLVDVPFATD
jgi:hypothetical protein